MRDHTILFHKDAKISAFYLEKQKRFIPKKIWSKPRVNWLQYQNNQLCLHTDPIFSYGFAFHSISTKKESRIFHTLIISRNVYLFIHTSTLNLNLLNFFQWAAKWIFWLSTSFLFSVLISIEMFYITEKQKMKEIEKKLVDSKFRTGCCFVVN